MFVTDCPVRCAYALPSGRPPPSYLDAGARWGARGRTFSTAADIFHCAAVGALVELSWTHAHGPGRAVLSASWVRDILRNLKHRAFLTNAPRSRAPGGLRVL